jgi:hypothetical protein
MGLGILYGQPSHYLTSDITNSADKLAAWIEREIPSFVGNVPSKYKGAVNSVLAKNYVRATIVRAAFGILERRGVRFDAASNDFQVSGVFTPTLPPYNPNVPNVREAPQIKPLSKGEADRNMAYTFEEWERRYVLAIKTDNVNEAENILAAVLQLLWDVARGYSKTKTAARNEKMVEWEEFNTAVNEALNRATTLQTHFRYMSREEVASLRNAPTPTAFRGLTVRFAARITTRTVPPARRGRR